LNKRDEAPAVDDNTHEAEQPITDAGPATEGEVAGVLPIPSYLVYCRERCEPDLKWCLNVRPYFLEPFPAKGKKLTMHSVIATGVTYATSFAKKWFAAARINVTCALTGKDV
jgi:hypothetical protein